MLKFLLLLATASSLRAQCVSPTIMLGSDTLAASRSVINANFTNVADCKAPKASPTFSGTITVTGLGTGALKATSGVIGLVTGTAGHCVHVDGSSAICSSGSVISVGMTGDNVIYNTSVTGSPVTNTGTLVPVLKTQTANTVLAGPSSAGPTAPTFRALSASDIPTIPATGVSGLPHSFTCNIGSATGTSVIATGDAGCYSDGGSFTVTSITRADIIGNAAALATCSITADIWLASGALPTSGDKISASAPAALSSATTNFNFARTAWTSATVTNPVFNVSVASVTGCVYAQVKVFYQ